MFTRRLVQGALLLSTSTVVAGCKSVTSNVASSNSPGTDLFEAGLHFSLTSYARAKPSLAALASMAAPGDAYLAIGSKDRFEVDTNMTADTVLQEHAAPSFKADFWIDAYVFGKQIGGAGSGGHGQVIEILVQASPDPAGVQAIIRYLGQEKYHGDIKGKWKQSFTRSLGDNATFYPVPLLGVTVTGNIGGEFGGRSEVVYQETQAIAVSFIPGISLHGGIGGGVKPLSFTSAIAEGQVTLIDTNIATVASLGYHPKLGMVVGDLGVEDGQFRTIDGKIVVKANADLSLGNKLPGGVPEKLWHSVTTKVTGSDKQQYAWEHTVWQPAKVPPHKLPPYGKYLHRFIQPPASVGECNDRFQQFEPDVRRYSEKVNASVEALAAGQSDPPDATVEDQMRAQATLKTNFNLLLAEVQSACAKM